MCPDTIKYPLAGSAGGAQFIEDIINGMYDWVRVLDRNDNIIYINRAMEMSVPKSAVGRKCYEVLGRSAPCENCISRKAVFDGESHMKEEVIGNRIFSVMSSPVRNSAGKIVAVVEVLRDVTDMKAIHEKLIRQNKKLEDDLILARKLQCRLLPKNSPDGRLDFSFVYKPCDKLGGDFLDIFRIDERHTGVYIADVSGHGVPASMLTVFLRSSINRKTLSPSLALAELYEEFNKSNFEPDLYITVFYAVIDLHAKTLTYSNAGHNVSPIIYSRDRFDLLRVPGIPISNWVDQPLYTEAVTKLKPGDRFFLYTDGVIEIKNGLGEQYGEERLLAHILEYGGSISALLRSTLESVTAFSGLEDTDTVPDDITMALVEIK